MIDRMIYSAALERGVSFLAYKLDVPPEDVEIDTSRLFALADQVEAVDGWLELRAVFPDVEVVLGVIHVVESESERAPGDDL